MSALHMDQVRNGAQWRLTPKVSTREARVSMVCVEARVQEAKTTALQAARGRWTATRVLALH